MLHWVMGGLMHLLKKETLGSALSCAFHLHCEQSAGWGLMEYANGSHYVIDVNISLWKFGDLILAFLGSFAGITAIICCCFCSCFGVSTCVCVCVRVSC